MEFLIGLITIILAIIGATISIAILGATVIICMKLLIKFINKVLDFKI